ncbi:MAG: amidase [Alphaproteobacteria bacterium]|jgi:amidase|nr:amidase [Alphaproteobacteria bacterium]
MTALNELTAAAAAKALAGGEITAEALAQACLGRIAAREETVRAWRHLDPEQVLAQARAADENGRPGPLHGLPVGIKDIIDTHDMPTRHGSPIYEDNRPPGDAACVALIRRAGGVVMGKTVTTEFASTTPRETRNPHNPAHTPGGSSSGSAAAVADFMVPLAYGTQTAGSVIRPGSFCGVTAYKASFGDLPMAGIKPFAPLLDSLGIYGRSVADTALLRSALTGAPAVPTSPTAAPRVGLCRTYEWDRADAATHAAVEGAAERFAGAGAAVDEVDLPEAFSGLVEAQNNVVTYEGARSYLSEYRLAPGDLSPGITELIEAGLAMPHAQYAEAWALGRSCQAEIAKILTGYDALLAPSAPGEAPEGLGATGDPLFNRIWTFLHLSAVSLPGHVGPNGLPVGVQAIGAFGGDDALLGVATWMEAALAEAG